MGLHEDKVELLRNIDIFSQLREYELDIIARYSDLIPFAKGDIIFSQGSPATELYVVIEGRVGIISLEDKNNIMIAQIIPKESFGELDLFGRTTRSATALAELDSMLLQFPANQFIIQDIFQEDSYISARMLYRLLGIIAERMWHVNTVLYDKSHWLQDLHKQLLCDKMTGLYNRTFLEENFANLLPDLGDNAALLMIKPDNFKKINDLYGHEAGDQVLNLLAIFLQSELGENDLCIRYGGDEFAAILSSTDKNTAIQKAKEINKTIKKIDLSGITAQDEFIIQLSMGIAIYPGDTDNSKKLVELAHERMHKARTAGGNRLNL